MVVGEVGGRPAVDGRADVLVGTDDDREDDETQDRVAVVQSVDDVVVVARARSRQLRDGRQHSIHRERCSPARPRPSLCRRLRRERVADPNLVVVNFCNVGQISNPPR